MTRGRRLHPALSGVLGILVLVLLWEGYKLIGPEKGWLVGKTRVLPRASDLAMLHVSTMISRLFEPTVGASTPPLWQTVLKAAIKSLGIAGVGWAPVRARLTIVRKEATRWACAESQLSTLARGVFPPFRARNSRRIAWK